MYSLIFNGEFQGPYPNEFLEDLKELQTKHGIEFFGKVAIRDLGNFVDFQKEDIDDSNTSDNTADLETENKSD